MSKIVTLDEIAEIKTGPFGTQFKASEYTKQGIPVINVKNIGYGNIVKSDLDFVNETTVERLSEHVLQKDDIVLGRKGSVDRHCIIRDNETGWLQGSDCIRVRIVSKAVNPLYVFYYLSLRCIKDQLSNSAVGSTMPSMNSKIIKNIEIKCPEKELQDKIAELLESINKKIEINRDIVMELGNAVKAIYDHWFLQYDFPDENSKPYKSSGGEMIWNEELKREIPVGWAVFPIGKLFTTNRGVSYNSATLEGKGIPMVNLASFTPTGAYKIDGIKNYSGDYTEDKVLKPYDLVMCNTQQTAIDYSKDIIGRALLVPDIFEGNIVSSHHVNTIRTVDEALKFHLYYLFNSDYFHKYVTGYANGTNIMGLVFEGVEKYISEIPEKRVLQEFAKLSLSIEKKKSEIIRENQELISLRDFLLPLLMNGQIRFRNVAISNKE